MPEFDITILTDPRYVSPKNTDQYIKNVLIEDQLVADALKAEGLGVIRKSWDDEEFDWSATKYALFRTTWDYFDRYPEFSKWLDHVTSHTKLINSEQLVYWNIDKHYMRDLHAKGVRIPQTRFIEKGEETTIAEAVRDLQTEYFILKPCVSGGARHTYKIHQSELSDHGSLFQELTASEAMMVQEFQQNIVDKGEISMMIMGGQFTHAVLKVAKPSDFRVQDDHGGSVHDHTPTQQEIDFALKVVAACPEPPLYARVDILEDNSGEIALAELELIEPELWFRNQPDAATILAKTIKDHIQ